MRATIGSILVAVAAAAAQPAQTFTGVVSDEVCATADHSRMRMGSTDAECARACVDAHGAEYILFDGKTGYTLHGRQPFEKFAGQRVRISGTLDRKTGTIEVASIAAAS
jgi:hypothetical protein